MADDADPKTDPLKPALEDQVNKHIGAHGELVLPDVVPIVNSEYATKYGLWMNMWWIRTHYLLRGIAGTGAEWFTFVVGAAAQYPKVSVILIAVLAVITEESFSEHPIFTNTIKYAMQSYDPDAASVIFAEKPVDPDPIGTAAKRIEAGATKEFLESPSYRLLKNEVEQDVQRQIRRQTYVAAGMTADVEAVDEEIAEARAKRAAERAKKKEEAAPKQTVPVETTSHTQGVPVQREEPQPEELQQEAAPTEEPVEPDRQSEQQTKPEGKAGKANPTRKVIRDALDEVVKGIPPLPPLPTKKKGH